MTERQPAAFVTGGAARVGRAIVEKLASTGFRVIFTYKTSAGAAEDLTARYGNAVRCIQVDLAEVERFEKQIVQAAESLGRLDLLVNCASVYQPDPSPPDLSFFQQTFKVNAEAPLRLMEWLAPLLKRNGGHVVNMIDILAERPWPAYRTYCASKAALLNLTLSMARQLAPEVTVNGIAPGVVQWPPDYPAAEKEKYLKRVPLGRAGTPEDVANLVHYLATDGRYITGQIIRLDGGRSIT
ncbi:MAG TPA: SDR family oxidoreductase [Tepidisphaeraceae bacterium]|jgi:pteridine reductase